MGRKQGGRNLQEVLEPFVTSQRTTILKNWKRCKKRMVWLWSVK